MGPGRRQQLIEICPGLISAGSFQQGILLLVRPRVLRGGSTLQGGTLQSDFEGDLLFEPLSGPPDFVGHQHLSYRRPRVDDDPDADFDHSHKTRDVTGCEPPRG